MRPINGLPLSKESMGLQSGAFVYAARCCLELLSVGPVQQQTYHGANASCGSELHTVACLQHCCIHKDSAYLVIFAHQSIAF